MFSNKKHIKHVIPEQVKVDGFDVFIHAVFEDFVLASKSDKPEKLYSIRNEQLNNKEDGK